MEKQWIALALLSPAFTLTAYAEVYLTDTQAVQLLFPGGGFARGTTELTPAEKETIEKNSKETVRALSLVVWRNKSGDRVFVDQVLGKHELITFAVGIAADGRVRGVEILEYRESYGQQVRNVEWRRQFVGKTKDSPLKLNDDIKNLSGATLSSAHVTAGVRRILHTYDVLAKRG